MNPLVEETVGGSRRMLVVLMAAVTMVLLVGCADVANLMLTHTHCRGSATLLYDSHSEQARRA